MAMASSSPIQEFKKAYYQVDETDSSQYRTLLDMANRIIFPSLPASTGAGGQWSSGRKQLTRKKKHRVSKKLKTRKH